MKEMSAVLLERTASGEYNERLRFFTREAGIISIFGFGTRSVKSRRGRLLASHDFLKITVKESRDASVLQDASIYRCLSFLQNVNKYLYFSSLLKKISACFAPGDPAPVLFSALLLQADILDENFYSEVSAKIIFNAACAVAAGFFPWFSGCEKCGKTDGNFNFSERFYCTDCRPDDKNIYLPEEIRLLNSLYSQAEAGRLPGLAVYRELSEREKSGQEFSAQLEKLNRLFTENFRR
ncbi:MAG: DNA repair protein RecO [Spirochaetes bacterium GWF1_41_5]|nr:MAG: DNA repair protein RecO [Spirochaetes bacterium GWF1_41_5]